MLAKNIYINHKFLYVIYFVNFLFEIKLVNSYISSKKIISYREESLYIDKDIPRKYYFYFNTKYGQEKNYDIILQLKDLLKENNNAFIYIYTSNEYISNLENLIAFDEKENELIGYQFKFQINSLKKNFSEFSLNDFNNTQNNSFSQYYYIIFSKDNIINNFSCNFIIFNTLEEIEIFPTDFTNKYYYRFENNYSSNKYAFKMNSKYIINNNLNIQFLSNNGNSFYNIDIYQIINEKNISQIYSLHNFNILDYSTKINNSQFLYFNLTSLDSIFSTKSSFSIFFNFLFNDKIQNIPSNTKEFYFLSQKEYYLYSIMDNLSYNDITKLNENLFYVMQILCNDNIEKNNNLILVEYFIYNESYNKEIKEENLINIIIKNKDSFVKMHSFYDNTDSLDFYKAPINKKENLNKLLILKISLNDSNMDNKLKLKYIYFRFFPLIILTEEIYNSNKSYIQYYNSSQHFLDKFGYYYIPINFLDKNKLIYCPYEKTMNLYLGEFDITENLKMTLLDNRKIYIINPLNSTLYSGITVVTLNRNSNYFFQFGEINEIIIDNLKIFNFVNDENINKEIKINKNIEELYIFSMYNFNSSFILDINIIYGNVTVEYLSLDILPDSYKNFNNIFPFNKNLLNNYIIPVNNPILIDSSQVEIIRVINNQYLTNINGTNNLDKSLFFINKYKKLSEMNENNLVPLFISSKEKFAKYKINLNSQNQAIQYTFLLYNGNPLNEDIDKYNVSININNESFYLSKKDNNDIHKGIINIEKYNQVTIINNCHKNVLILGHIGNLQEQVYEIIFASEKSFNNIMISGKIYLFVFDYINIIKKAEKEGLYPYKFIFNLEKPFSNRCNGYYQHSFSSENFQENNYIFSPSKINSIYYEIIQTGNNFSFFNDISFEEFHYIFNNKSLYLYTIIQQITGYLKVDFHIEYIYDLSNKKNELAFFNYNDSIYSANYKLDKENNNYLLFQVLSCGNNKDYNVLFYKENTNISYSLDKNDDNGQIKRITKDNIFGFIDLNKEKNYESGKNILEIIKPRKFFIQYMYSNLKVNNELIDYIIMQNKYKYNINIEKIRKIENKDIFSISFDCFIKDTITNYYILILEDKEEDIINECKFLSYLYNFNKKHFLEKANNYRILSDSFIYNKYISFKDEGITDRISREITFENFGNYKIYILAEEIENYSIYKLLGEKTYSYVKDGNEDNNNENEDENEVSIVLILLIVLLSLLIIILLIFIFYHYVRKENINQIISFMTLPNKDSMNSNKNNMLLSFANNRNEKENDSDNNLFFPILKNSNIELEEEKKEDNLKNVKKIENNSINNNELENCEDKNDYDIEEPPPPPVTLIPPESKISKMIDEIKQGNSNCKFYDEDKIFTNDGTDETNKGE